MSEANIRKAFRDQTIACRNLGSPLTAQICEILAEALQSDQGEVARIVLGWQGDRTPKTDAVPLRLCGGLHALVLTGRDSDLAAAYAQKNPSADVLINAMQAHEAYLLQWLESPPQTNEIARASAIIAAARFVVAEHNLPLRALELGASAGLNLNFPHFQLNPEGISQPSGIFGKGDAARVELCPQWEGDLPVAAIEVPHAEGVDLRPIDPAQDELRLLAYCWADQEARMARLREAIKLAQAFPKQVTAGDAASWLTDRLSKPVTGQTTFVYHTIAWQYFPPRTQDICEDALQKAGAVASLDAPLAHFSMEADGGNGAALRLRLWDGNLRVWQLGRMDFHGRWVRWNPSLL